MAHGIQGKRVTCRRRRGWSPRVLCYRVPGSHLGGMPAISDQYVCLCQLQCCCAAVQPCSHARPLGEIRKAGAGYERQQLARLLLCQAPYVPTLRLPTYVLSAFILPLPLPLGPQPSPRTFESGK